MKPDRPIIVFDDNLDTGIRQELFRIGREREWALLDLRFTGNDVPAGLRPVGAFVSRLPDDPFVKRLLDEGCHVVRLGNAPHRNDDLVPAVLPDLALTGALAAEHFAELGFLHLGFVGYEPWGIYQHLYDGFRARASELGCECHKFQWRSAANLRKDGSAGSRYNSRLKLFKDWLSALPRPLGLLGFTDARAWLYNRMCMDSGFEVPSEIGILGVGNDATICETVYPSMSSIVVDYETMAETAVEIFENLSSGNMIEETTIRTPPKGLIARKSTDTIVAATPGVAKAIRFMLDHYTEPIGIREITRSAGMSRARLFAAFDSDLGQPPGAVLTRIRIDKAKCMLRGTGEKVATISEACGFGASINMYHHFKRHLSMSPGSYRKAQEQHP